MPEIIDAYTTPGTERETACPADELLRTMDAHHIGRAVIAPEDREIALHNERGNERIVKLAARSGGRFIPACSVNPWHGERGAAMLRDAVAAGARMLVLAPALQGFMLTDDVADPLLEAAGALNLPVYVHTGPHGASAPTQLALVAEQHPRTPLILAHGGGTDHSWDMPAVLRQAPANVWFDLSFVRPWGIAAWRTHVGDERLIFATGAPRTDVGLELRHFGESLPIAEHPNIYGANIRRLVEGVRA